ncbi:hypothetical protein KSS87_020712 [Heliosperma pusillum]|nr:hypothetical protein KSS87_020712 [Heliosperma pusillum]
MYSTNMIWRRYVEITMFVISVTHRGRAGLFTAKNATLIFIPNVPWRIMENQKKTTMVKPRIKLAIFVKLQQLVKTGYLKKSLG